MTSKKTDKTNRSNPPRQNKNIIMILIGFILIALLIGIASVLFINQDSGFSIKSQTEVIPAVKTTESLSTQIISWEDNIELNCKTRLKKTQKKNIKPNPNKENDIILSVDADVDTLPEDTSKDTSSTTSTDTSKDTSSTTSTDTSKDTSSTTSTDTSKDTSSTTSTDTSKDTSSSTSSSSGQYYYQSLYPDMVAEPSTGFTDDASEKIVYLTFDDGASANTQEILDILDDYGIKATFFVKLDTSRASLYKSIVEKGHEIALHTTTHDYKTIYASVEAFLDDYYTIFNFIKDTTGVSPTLMRYPGGSVNSYNKNTYNAIIDEMLRRGFVYHDWNVDSYDSRSNTTATDIINAVKEQTQNKGKCIILLHDTADKDKTVEALPSIIENLIAQGYEFEALDNTVKPYTFKR